VALLEQPLAQRLPAENPQQFRVVPIRHYDANGLILDVDFEDKALLVLTEAWYPGWQAEVDGQISPCVPANLWMRAIPVPAGHHQVRMYFRQDGLVLGALISTISALVLLLVLLQHS